jgi:AcrR family transcriptional regulator
MTSRDIQREETKKRIYDSAFALFQTKGFQNTKVQDIARLAGVAVGSVYYHYKNKEDIIDFGYYKFDESLKEHYENTPHHSNGDAIRDLIRFQMQSCVDQGEAIISITFKNQINAENTYLYSGQRYLGQKLTVNLRDAGVKKDSPEEAAKVILRSVRGCVYDWCTHQGKYDLMKVSMHQLEILLDYYEVQ